MKNFLEKVEKIGGKMASEVHLLAIRDTMMTLIPFTLLAGLCAFFNYVLLDPSGKIASLFDETTLANITTFFTRINAGTLGIFSILVVVLLSNKLATRKGYENPMMVCLTSLAVFFIFMPLAQTYALFSTSGMMIAIVVALSCTEIFIRLSSIDKLKIKISGGSIPEAIITSFNSIITICIVLLGYALIAVLLNVITGLEIGDLITSILQKPLVNVGATLPGAILFYFLTTVLFFFGIHNASVTVPIFDPIFVAAFETGSIVNYSFVNTYGCMGGVGSTISLLLIMLFFTKKKELKYLARMAAPASLFNINEPVVFGIPIVYNLYFIVPFIGVPIINMIVAYFATALGLVSKMVNYVTWSTPPLLNFFIASNGDIRNVILGIVLIAIDFCIYFVFFKIYEKSLDKKQS